jgi:hypothetical protein
MRGVRHALAGECFALDSSRRIRFQHRKNPTNSLVISESVEVVCGLFFGRLPWWKFSFLGQLNFLAIHVLPIAVCFKCYPLNQDRNPSVSKRTPFPIASFFVKSNSPTPANSFILLGWMQIHAVPHAALLRFEPHSKDCPKGIRQSRDCRGV